MSTLKYVGPHTGVRLVMPSGKEVEIANGAMIDLAEHVPERDLAAFAASLLDQPTNWQAVSKPTADKQPAKGAKGED